MKGAIALLAASLACTGAWAVWVDRECMNRPPTLPRDRLPFKEGDRKGYLDRDFKVAVPAQFFDVREFIDGLAWAARPDDKASILIDKAGKVVFDAYLKANAAEYGTALYGDPLVRGPTSGLVMLEVLGTNPENPQHRRYGYKDLAGHWRIDPDFDDAEPFSEGLAAVRIHDPQNFLSVRAGYIRPDGTVAIKLTFKRAWSFSEGLAVVENLDRSLGVIDTTGKLLFSTTRYESIDTYSNGLAPAKRGPADYVLLRPDGTVLPTPSLAFAKPFKDKLAAVQIGGKNKLDRFEPYNLEGGSWGYLNTQGELAIAASFDWACSFSEGLAAVNLGAKSDRAHMASGGKWGYINEAGTLVIQPAFSRADPFVDGIAHVVIDKHDAYIDRSGRVLWPAAKP